MNVQRGVHDEHQQRMHFFIRARQGNETTIYLDPAAQGRGVGTALLGELVSLARADEKVHTLLGLIVDT